MLKIENKSKDTIKSYSFKLENGKSIIKTKKDFPISKTIEIKRNKYVETITRNN